MASGNVGADAFRGSNFTVTSTAAELVNRIDSEQRSINIRSVKTNTATVYLGGDINVTTATGYPIYPGEAYSIPTRSPIFGLTDGADADCRWTVEAA